jgi:hypothetical protein
VSSRDLIRREWDYVIVGGGTAGCVLAARLTERRGARVLLLEAGGEYAQVLSVPLVGMRRSVVFSWKCVRCRRQRKTCRCFRFGTGGTVVQGRRGASDTSSCALSDSPLRDDDHPAGLRARALPRGDAKNVVALLAFSELVPGGDAIRRRWERRLALPRPLSELWLRRGRRVDQRARELLHRLGMRHERV